jgi:3-hydroxy-9,10-secoandrosta-1,3,5(10)-triene-9,17-dione monooxygenase
MDRDELLQRATQLVPTLRERAGRAEALRQIPPETVKDFVSSGLSRVGNPTRYGGYGLDLDTVHEIAWELGRGCGSTAWCCSLWMTHNWWLGHFPLELQEEYFASGPDTLFSSGLNPLSGTAEPARGGFRVSGRWSYSSGCDASTWAMVSCGASREQMLWLMLPRAEYEIVDTWFASGLRGSGSKDIVVRDAFVPAHRAIDPNRAGDGDTTGWDLHQRRGYRAPLRALAGWDLAAPIIGMAQGAVEEFTARLQTARDGSADAVPLQLRLAEASAEVDAARTLQREDIREILDMAVRGEPFSALDRARYRRDKAFVVKLSVQAVNRLFEAAGARAVLESHPLQRFHRDAHSASHHGALGWDAAAELYGRQAIRGG